MKTAALFTAVIATTSAFVVTPATQRPTTALPAGIELGASAETLYAAGAAAVAGLAGLATSLRGKNKSNASTANKSGPKAELVDVSIPYNAAAQLAFKDYSSSCKFEDFEPLYLQQAVAQVTAKQVEREMQRKVQEAQATADKAQAALEALKQ